jgi:hypothetical protein
LKRPSLTGLWLNVLAKNSFIGGVFLVFSGICTPLSAELVPYESSYYGYINGKRFGAEGTTRLIRLGENRYQATVLVDHFFFDLFEQSEFSVIDDGYRPLKYQSRRDTLFSERHKTLEFDWEAGKLSYAYKKKKGSHPLPAVAYDPMTMELALAALIRQDSSPRQITLPEGDYRGIKTRKFEIKGLSQLETALGTMDVIQITQIRDKESERLTHFWFAPELNYLLVRVAHVDGDESYELRIQSFKPTVDNDKAALSQE